MSKLKDRGKGGLGANNRLFSLAGAEGGGRGCIPAEKPKCQVSGDIRKGSGRRKEAGKTKTSAEEGEDNESTQG